MTKSYCWDSPDYMTNINEGDWENENNHTKHILIYVVLLLAFVYEKRQKKNISLGYYLRLARLIARLIV